jgi:hypothetical protein
MVLDPFGVDPGRLRTDAERAQERLDRLVARPAFLGYRPPRLGEEDAAVGLAGDEAIGGEPGQHLGDGGLGHPHAGGDVDLTGFVAVLDEISDEFHVVFDQGAPLGLARLPEAFRMHLGIGEWLLPKIGAAGTGQGDHPDLSGRALGADTLQL